jgi:hypothetical protein
MTEPTRFTVTKDHLRLLRHMGVEWNDTESGAPMINPKRPYGNSNVPTDVADVLGWTVLMDPEDWVMQPEQSEKAWAIHRQMDTVLQIVLCTGQFEPGTYVKMNEYDGTSWRFIEAVKP